MCLPQLARFLSPLFCPGCVLQASDGSGVIAGAAGGGVCADARTPVSRSIKTMLSEVLIVSACRGEVDRIVKFSPWVQRFFLVAFLYVFVAPLRVFVVFLLAVGLRTRAFPFLEASIVTRTCSKYSAASASFVGTLTCDATV